MSTSMTPPGSPAMTRQEIQNPVPLPGQAAARGTWVQTERKAHEAWARLVLKNGRAAALLHLLTARMGERNAVVISRATLAALLNCSEATVKRAVRDLRTENWISTVSLGGKGGVNAYVINSQVAWQQDRSKLYLSVFDARVIASADEQEEDTLKPVELHQLPQMRGDEWQLPSGAGEEPPAQPALVGLEPDLPALKKAEPFLRVERTEDGLFNGAVIQDGVGIATFLYAPSLEHLRKHVLNLGHQIAFVEMV